MTAIRMSVTEQIFVHLLDELDELRSAHADAVARQDYSLADTFLMQIKNRAREIDKLRSCQPQPPFRVRSVRTTQP